MKHIFIASIATLTLILSACSLQVQATPAELAAYQATVQARTPALPTVTPSIQPTDTCNIKVNRSANGTLIYHMPGQANYTTTLIEPAKGEFMACDEQQAIDAGARKALR